MPFAHTHSATVLGVEAFPIQVEVDMSPGLPSFSIVGMPDSIIRESRERITAALKNSGFPLKNGRITCNLAPADIRKAGSAFDLPIAACLLAANGMFPSEKLANLMLVGELSLEGKLRPIRGVLAAAITAQSLNMKGIALPTANQHEAQLLPNLSLYPLSNLKALVSWLRDGQEPTLSAAQPPAHHEVLPEKDLQDVKGQIHVKRVMEIAAAGGHHVLMIGPPGSGKTMLAERLSALLPRLSLEEALEISRIYSTAGLIDTKYPLMNTRPFRAPHHSISRAGLLGGGSIPHPGEISLAHHGVLFLDELAEFPRQTLESLRQPLESKQIVIARAAFSVPFPANFQLVCAMNPCPCGYLGSSTRACTCSELQIKNYRGRISGPLLDRMDLCVEVPAVPLEALQMRRGGLSSQQVRQKVEAARTLQLNRFAGSGTLNNSLMTPSELETHAEPSIEGLALLRKAQEKIHLTARSHHRILKVARTIADLEDSHAIQLPHLSEAIQHHRHYAFY